MTMEHAYAQALSGTIQKGVKPADAVRALKRSLDARGRSALLPKIAHAFARLSAREEARNRMTLSIARQKDAQRAVKEAEKFLAREHISEADVCEEVDESLIGGWRLEGKGVLVDASWKKDLLSIYNRSTS